MAMMVRRKLGLLALLLVCGACHANVALRRIFSDNMVLQQGVEVPIFGTADPVEKISVTLNDQTAYATVRNDGTWVAKLDPLKAGGPFELTVKGAANTITLKNVLVGEVWIASGQSNMGFNLGSAINAKEVVAASANPNLRLFTVNTITAQTLQSDLLLRRPTDKLSWVQAGPNTTPGFSAVAYFFARDLQAKLGVPVGIINTSWGGTAAEAWTPTGYLEKDPDLKPMLDQWERRIADSAKAKDRFDTITLPAWKKAVEEAKAAGRPAPRQPRPPEGADSPNRPGNLYNAMINPLVPFAFKGAIWYQGESNSGRAWQYRKLMPTMIQSWRDAWKEGDFGFYIVALAPYMAIQPQPKPSSWAELREAQYLTTKALPNVGLAVIDDVGEPDNIHPKQKEPVGARLALQAEAKSYGLPVACDGPTFKGLKVEGAAVRVTFDHADGGLAVKGFKVAGAQPGGPNAQWDWLEPNSDPAAMTVRGDKPVGFEVAGADHKWFRAAAKIDGDSVVVSSDDVKEPVAVRFGWADFPVVNLYNGAGLPAVPFRTDDWPGLTDKAR
jgi:sialate O-acetylesterase